MAQAQSWKPHQSLTDAPTNLKEAIDWVLRVTGKDGKKNTAAAQPPQYGCLCFLAKAVKDLLYDAKDPGSPGPSPGRNWSDILLEQEKTIVQPVLQDLGLLSAGTSATSTTYTCAGGTEVIKALLDHLSQGLQKWIGWQEDDECCLGQTKGGSSDGIGKACKPGGGGARKCCIDNGKASHECDTCGKDINSVNDKCYLSAYCKSKSSSSGTGSSTTECYYWPTLSDRPDQVHLLARIFLGSVCLIWSGLSQLGFLTGGSGSRWKESTLHGIEGANVGLGSFMAAMGYDLERLNGSGTSRGE